MGDGQGIARWVRPIGRRVGQDKKPLPPKEGEGGCRDQRGEITSRVSRSASVWVCGGLHPALRRCLVWCITASGRPFHQGRSPCLASSGFGSPGSCFWRLELREGVEDEPRPRGQVASHSDYQPNYPPRLESRIKTRRVHFFFGCACLCAGLSCLSRIVKCLCCTLFALLSRITLPLRAPLIPQLLL